MGFNRSSKTNSTEAWLLIWLTKAFGLFPQRTCRSKFGGFLYSAALIIVYYICFIAIAGFARNYYNGLEQVSLVGAMRWNGYLFNLFYLPLMIIPSIRHSGKVRTIYEEMNDINKGFEYLNIRLNYDLKIKRDTLHVLSFVLVTIIFNMLDYFFLWEDGSGGKFILMWIIGCTPEFVNSLVICQFGILSGNLASLLAETDKIINAMTEGKSGKASDSEIGDGKDMICN